MEDGKGIVSLIGRVKKSLIQIAANPAKGPFYAARSARLSYGAKDLSCWMDGFIERSRVDLEPGRSGYASFGNEPGPML